VAVGLKVFCLAFNYCSVGRQVDVRVEFQISQFSTLGDFGREKR
jgi:hypothetical protein